mmetsp:Transcript_33554/g.41296  ORF Transcript_33554/g.41296 Transcript_33554/m.41296 type:complete len:80 (-) Transcript_33554:39-278(-)
MDACLEKVMGTGATTRTWGTMDCAGEEARDAAVENDVGAATEAEISLLGYLSGDMLVRTGYPRVFHGGYTACRVGACAT